MIYYPPEQGTREVLRAGGSSPMGIIDTTPNVYQPGSYKYCSQMPLVAADVEYAIDANTNREH